MKPALLLLLSSFVMSTSPHTHVWGTLPLTDESTYREKIEESSGSHLVYFSSKSCQHCKDFDPIYENMPANVPKSNPSVWKVDCSEEKDLCYRLRVKSVPEIRLIDHGKVFVFEAARTLHNLIVFAERGHLSQKPILLDKEPPGYIEEAGEGFLFLKKLLLDIFASDEKVLKIVMGLFVLILVVTLGLSVYMCVSPLLGPKVVKIKRD